MNRGKRRCVARGCVVWILRFGIVAAIGGCSCTLPDDSSVLFHLLALLHLSCCYCYILCTRLLGQLLDSHHPGLMLLLSDVLEALSTEDMGAGSSDAGVDLGPQGPAMRVARLMCSLMDVTCSHTLRCGK